MPFVKKQKPTDPTIPVSVLDHPNPLTVKECRSACGQARKTIDELEAQREIACRELTTVDDSMDITAAASINLQAQEKLDFIDKALLLARERSVRADGALKDAHERVQRDELRKDLVKLNDRAKAVVVWADSGKPVVDAYHEQRKVVLGYGCPEIDYVLNVANLSFQTYLYRSCSPMANCNTGYAVFQTDVKWSQPWWMINPQPDMAETVKLT